MVYSTYRDFDIVRYQILVEKKRIQTWNEFEWSNGCVVSWLGILTMRGVRSPGVHFMNYMSVITKLYVQRNEQTLSINDRQPVGSDCIGA